MPAQVKVFIGWSGPRSKVLAMALRDWLPQVIQSVEPWLSEAMDRGAQWFATIGTELRKADYGVLCVTPENAGEPWVLFEAGALALRTSERLACPYLLDMIPTDLEGPLAQLQAAVADHDGTLKVVQTINKLLDQGVQLSEARLERTFEKWWPELEGKIDEARQAVAAPAAVPDRSDSDKIDEILEAVRAFQRSHSRALDTVVPTTNLGFGSPLETALLNSMGYGKSAPPGLLDDNFLRKLGQIVSDRPPEQVQTPPSPASPSVRPRISRARRKPDENK